MPRPARQLDWGRANGRPGSEEEAAAGRVRSDRPCPAERRWTQGSAWPRAAGVASVTECTERPRELPASSGGLELSASHGAESGAVDREMTVDDSQSVDRVLAPV